MTLKEERELKKAAKLEAEKQRIEAMREYEEMYDTFSYICGIDEAGRGPLAGPVVAGAVILPKGKRILYVNDSKKLSEKKREELFDVIKEVRIIIINIKIEIIINLLLLDLFFEETLPSNKSSMLTLKSLLISFNKLTSGIFLPEKKAGSLKTIPVRLPATITIALKTM